MIRKILLLSIVFIVFLSVSGSSYAGSGSNVQAYQIVKGIAGTAGEVKWENGDSYRVTYAADGTLKMKRADGTVEKGTWWLQPGEKVCHQWDEYLNGKEACFDVERQGGSILFKGDVGNFLATLVKH